MPRSRVLPFALAAQLAAGTAVAPLSPAEPDAVAVDMESGWLRRDWRQCRDRTQVTFADGAITLASESSAALLWQVPTLLGPATPDAGADWAKRCERPPLSFSRSLRGRVDEGRLVDLERYPILTWRWRVDATIDDSSLADGDGRIRRERNDFAAKLGVLVGEVGSDEVEELAYVWTRSLPEGTLVYQESVIVPLVWKQRWYRRVVETGERALNRWVSESHDLAADLRQIFPGRRPGRVLRVYVMTDSDNTGGRATASYSSIAFRSRRP